MDQEGYILELLLLLSDSLDDLKSAVLQLIPSLPPILNLLFLLEFLQRVINAFGSVVFLQLTDFFFLNDGKQFLEISLSELTADVLHSLNPFSQICHIDLALLQLIEATAAQILLNHCI